MTPCPSKASPRQQPCRVTAAFALSPADCGILSLVLPREMGCRQPAGHKALLHCRVRCRPRCCHRERPGPSLGLRTIKTFRRFRGCETSFWCSPDVVSGWGRRLRRSASAALTVTTGLALSRRSGSGLTGAGPSPRAEAPSSGQDHLNRRRVSGRRQSPHREQAAEAVTELSTTSRRHRRVPRTSTDTGNRRR